LTNLQYAAKVLDEGRRSAVLRWADQFDDLEAGLNIWEKHGFPNPPMMALVLRPLMLLAPPVAALAWFYIKVSCAVAALFLLFRMLDANVGQTFLSASGKADRNVCPTFPWWAKVLAVLLSLRPIQQDLTHGNVNLFILLLLIAGLYAFAHGRDMAAGLLLGLAMACRVTPLLFLPYLAWKRAWKALAWNCASVAFFTLLVPGLAFGWQRNLTFLESWYDYMARPYATEGAVLYSDHKNQSLPGLAARMLTDSPSFTSFDFEKDHYVGLEYYNVAAWDAGAVRWLVLGCFAVYGLMTLWLCRTPRDNWPRDPRAGACLAAEFGIVLLGMLLFCERTWKHHAVTLCVPFAVLAYALSVASTWKTRWRLGALLAAAVLCMLSTSSGFWLGNDRLADLAMVYGAYVWAFLLVLVGMSLVLRQESRTDGSTK
ncbi:MAG: DUF2029 domain-containing protein, partial [Gemmataceae bacterium]|nr:DUF2029 domain-containing protein [Gemmataceae bacterium]